MNPLPPPRPHGGPGPDGPVRWDFSTNGNAAGPCPMAWLAVQQADPCRYPDPTYTRLRQRLADWHGVAPHRILPAASGSEFIQRITAVAGRLAPGPVAVPTLAYGDYASAAAACARPVLHDGPGQAPAPATLRWCTDPGSPLGQPQPPPPPSALTACTTVLDCAYAPLRLDAASVWPPAALEQVFQLHTPNKALGLTGVRAAYVVAPADAERRHPALMQALRAAEPSWPLGAHGVALLMAWTDAATQTWVASSLQRLAWWTAQLRTGLQALGLSPQPSVTPFLCALRPAAATAPWLQQRGLALRCTASFGLPGGMRLSAQPPEATAALLQALRQALDLSPPPAWPQPWPVFNPWAPQAGDPRACP